MSFLLSPICNEQQVDQNGSPLSGGTIETYVAGTSTPAPTYTSISGAVPQTNPIVLNTLGLAPSPIWLDSTLIYKFIVKDSVGIVQRTIDNISGVSSSIPIQDQWVIYPGAPTFITGTSFSLTGDQTGIFQIARRVRTTNTGGVVYGTISGSVFGAVTTVTIIPDSGTLDAGLSQVSYGLLSPVDPSFTPIPRGSIMAFFQAAAPIGWTQVVTQNNKALRVVSGAGGGTGGSLTFTAAFGSRGISGSNSAVTLTESQIPSHVHPGVTNVNVGGQNVGSGTPPLIANPSISTGATGGGLSHNHTFTGTNLDLAVQYIDLIIASKN